MNSCRSAQLAFMFGGLLGQDVTFEGLAAFDGATWTDAEALLRRALGLHFGHVHAPIHCAREAPANYLQSCWPRATFEWQMLLHHFSATLSKASLSRRVLTHPRFVAHRLCSQHTKFFKPPRLPQASR